jgi:hypothetical protein
MSAKGHECSLYEVWPQSKVVLPPRSRLYSITPIRLDTAYVESLTSYFTRLSATHYVSPAVLLSQEVAPLINKSYLFRGGARPGTGGSALADSFRIHTRAINSMGVITVDWIGALESLTLRNDLQKLTMLPWSNVLSQRHLLRASRAWCPVCYEEWRQNDKTIYDPLLWTLSEFNICLHHQIKLATQCPHCRRSLSLLARRSQSGCCSKCGLWLGKICSQETRENAPTKSDLEWLNWTGRNLEALITKTFKAPGLSRKRIQEATRACIRLMSNGVSARFAACIQKPKNTIWGWMHGKTKIPLGDLLRVCFYSGITLVEFFTSDSLCNYGRAGKCFSGHLPYISRTPRRPRPFDREGVRRMLEAALENKPPPSVNELARRLNFHRRFLYKHFSVLCREITFQRKCFLI